jgi:hypothetical protein
MIESPIPIRDRMSLWRFPLTFFVLLMAGWTIFDGLHALVTGDFVTPKTGPYAGQLGPWAAVFEAVGIPPRSEAVAVGFVAYGSVYLGFLGAFLVRRRFGWLGLLACAILGLVYLVVGTVLNALILAMLWLPSVRRQDGHRDRSSAGRRVTS